jgi:hypothetical protein
MWQTPSQERRHTTRLWRFVALEQDQVIGRPCFPRLSGLVELVLAGYVTRASSHVRTI